MKKIYEHKDVKVNRDLNSVYKNIQSIDIESKKQKSLLTVKSFPSKMKEGVMYVDDQFKVRIKKNGIVKEFTLTEV